MEKTIFKKLIDLYKKEKKFTKQDVEENMILVNRDGFDLIIPKDNKEEHGCFLVNSVKGHDCYSYNSVSVHIYNILEGEGEFIINDKSIIVKKGDKITIQPNEIFYYSGEMLMMFEMFPNFKEENNHVVKKVTYI
ncbi:MAG: hypothetical protein J6A89_07815 [Clostridia bacterium]|nr:hypothetical protein [Clostridia bacterium]